MAWFGRGEVAVILAHDGGYGVVGIGDVRFGMLGGWQLELVRGLPDY